MTAAIVILSCLVLVGVAGQAFMMHKNKEHDTSPLSSGAAEAMLGVVGTLFSVLLGLLVAGAIERYHDIMVDVENEADGVANIFRLSKGLDETDRVRLRGLCREYTKYVISEEWEAMKDQKMSPQAQDRYSKLWQACVSVEPKTNERMINLHSAILENIDHLGECRRARAIASTTGLPSTLWAVIILGSAITIAFTYLFTVRMGALHWMMTGLVAVSLSLNIWLLVAYSSPFSGDLQLQPKGFLLMDNSLFQESDTQALYLPPSPQNSYANQSQQAR
jgi:hypothetical protein